MGRRTDALTAGLVAAVVATTVAFRVGRDRRLALGAGGRSGTMTALATALTAGGTDWPLGPTWVLGC